MGELPKTVGGGAPRRGHNAGTRQRASQNTADLFLSRNTPLRWGRRGCACSSGARSHAPNSRGGGLQPDACARSGAAHSRAVNQPSGCGGQVKKQEILIILHFVKLGNNLCSIFQMVDDCVNNLAHFSLCCCCCRSGGHGARRPCLNRPEGMI